MRHLARALVLAAETLLVLLAINGVLDNWGSLETDPVWSILPEALRPVTPAMTRLYWLAALLLPVSHGLAVLAMRRREQSIVLKSSRNENLSLYRSAIVQYIGNVMAEIPAVLGHRIRVRQAGQEGLAVAIHVTLRPVDQVLALQEAIEGTIRRRLSDLLGPAKVHEIRIVVEEFGESPPRPSAAAEGISISPPGETLRTAGGPASRRAAGGSAHEEPPTALIAPTAVVEAPAPREIVFTGELADPSGTAPDSSVEEEAESVQGEGQRGLTLETAAEEGEGAEERREAHFTVLRRPEANPEPSVPAEPNEEDPTAEQAPRT